MSVLKLSILFLMLLCGAMTALDVCAQSVTVYTLSELPPVHSREKIHLVYLDKPQRMMQTLNATKGINNKLSAGEVMHIITATHGQHYLNSVGEAVAAVVRARSRGVKYLPAIVIDDDYAVYGVYDVEQARARVHRYLSAHGGRQ